MAPQSPNLDPLRAKIERARAEGRFQQALELSKQFFKSNPTPEHRTLLKTVTLERAKQLRQQGYMRDAAATLETAIRLDENDPAWISQLAQEISLTGEIEKINEFQRRLPADSPLTQSLQFQLLDLAVEKEAAGRHLVPAALQAEFDCILRAFAQLERGEDDAVRETLQTIGLRSPLNEWKLLLRGLQAYYQQDDARALDNWQRLTPTRLPAQLAAPFRAKIDADYRTIQSAEMQAALNSRFDRLQGAGIALTLQATRSLMSSGKSLAAAFKQVESILPQLRQQNPQLVPRLANCFYWAILHSTPADIAPYRRVFGSPPYDLEFHRLLAMGIEKIDEALDEAFQLWQAYEKEIASHPQLWPSGQADRARALLWLHMGQLAIQIEEDYEAPRNPFLRIKQKPVEANPITCYLAAQKLAPDQVEPYRALFEFERGENRPAKAEQWAKKLLEHFPQHVETLRDLAALLNTRKKYAESLAIYQRALNVNPLDRNLRSEVKEACLLCADQFAEAEQFAEARQHYEEALSFATQPNDPTILARWAGAEFLCMNYGQAEALIQRAQQSGDAPWLCYLLLIQVTLKKLPPKVKKRFDDEFKALLKTPAQQTTALALLDATARLQRQEIIYTGSKTHRTKILAYLRSALAAAPWTKDALIAACCNLLELKAARELREVIQVGERQFAGSPYFPYFDACMELLKEKRANTHRAHLSLENAREKAISLTGEEARRLLEQIDEKEAILDELNPFNKIYRSIMEGFGGPFGGPFGGRPDDDFDEDGDFDEDEG